MSLPSRFARALAAALASVVMLAGLAGPASALEPPRPLPGYRPVFVTETDSRPWQDCLWASGAMLLDKWTSGEIQLTRQALRALSGDRDGGSTLAALQAAYARVGVSLSYSPDGGARITWPQLLDQLAHGAGAVLLGDDSKLPRWFGRWDPAFWKATGDKGGHAVYIERYDAWYGRVWLMDPLGGGDWRGEWISVSALRKFAWTQGGALSVAVSPTAQPAPFASVTAGAPEVTLTATTLEVAWDLSSPPGWELPGADVAATFMPAVDPLAAAAAQAAALASAPGPATGGPPLAAPAEGAVLASSANSVSSGGETTGDTLPAAAATVAPHGIRASAPLPTAPGAYQATLTVTDRRFGRVVTSVVDAPVFVPGLRRATLGLYAPNSDVVAGDSIAVTLSVANTGALTWADDLQGAAIPGAVPVILNTRLVARWVPIGVPAASPTEAVASADQAPPSSIDLAPVPLAPGRLAQIGGDVVVPSTPGTWVLVVDVADDVGGSFAALGSTPVAQVFRVVPARGIAPSD